MTRDSLGDVTAQKLLPGLTKPRAWVLGRSFSTLPRTGKELIWSRDVPRDQNIHSTTAQILWSGMGPRFGGLKKQCFQ